MLFDWRQNPKWFAHCSQQTAMHIKITLVATENQSAIEEFRIGRQRFEDEFWLFLFITKARTFLRLIGVDCSAKCDLPDSKLKLEIRKLICCRHRRQTRYVTSR
eukprot:554270_1